MLSGRWTMRRLRGGRGNVRYLGYEAAAPGLRGVKTTQQNAWSEVSTGSQTRHMRVCTEMASCSSRVFIRVGNALKFLNSTAALSSPQTRFLTKGPVPTPRLPSAFHLASPFSLSRSTPLVPRRRAKLGIEAVIPISKLAPRVPPSFLLKRELIRLRSHEANPR